LRLTLVACFWRFPVFLHCIIFWKREKTLQRSHCLPLSETQCYAHTAIDLRCKHTTGNIRVTLLKAEDSCDTSGNRRTQRRSRFVRVEAHRGRNKTLVTSGRRGANVEFRSCIAYKRDNAFSSCLSLLFYFYFILNPIPYLYLWISVKRCIRSIRTATPRHFFVERRFHLNFSLSLFLSFFLPAFLLLQCSHQRINDDSSISMRQPRLFARVRGTLGIFFLVFRPFSFTIARFRVTMTRFYTSVRALCQRGYVCMFVLYTHIYTHTYLHIRIMYVCVRVYICIYVCMYVCVLRNHVCMWFVSIECHSPLVIRLISSNAHSIFGVFSLAVAQYPPWGMTQKWRRSLSIGNP